MPEEQVNPASRERSWSVCATYPSRKTQDLRSRILHAESATQNASRTPACQLTRSAIQDRNGLTSPGSPLPVASHHGPHVNSTTKSHLPRVRLQGHSQKGEATQSPSNAPNLPVRGMPWSGSRVPLGRIESIPSSIFWRRSQSTISATLSLRPRAFSANDLAWRFPSERSDPG